MRNTRLPGGSTALAWVLSALLLVACQPDPELPPMDLSAAEPQVAEAINRYADAVRKTPEDSNAWAGLASALHAHDLFDPALPAYAKAMELSPRDARWPYLAAIAQAKSDPAASLPLYDRAIALRPKHAAIYINHGDVLFRIGETAAARQSYQKALELDSASSHARYGLAQVSLVDGDTTQAIALLEAALAAAPNHNELYGLLAQAHQRAGDTEAARRYSMISRARPGTTRAADPIVQAMEALAVDSQAISRSGVALAKRGEFRKAEAMFREVLSVRPGNARDYANLGGALAGQGRAEAAIAAYREGLELDPDDADLLNNLGYTLLVAGRLGDARTQLQNALRAQPGFAPALGNLGLLAAARQDSREAIRRYGQAIDSNPGLLFARNGLARQLALADRRAEAVEQWQTVLSIEPGNMLALHNLAITQSSMGNHGEAIDALRKGIAMAPNSSRFVAALAWELATAPEDGLRDGAEAQKLAQRLYAARPQDPIILDVMAAALAERGNFDQAVTLMERALSTGGGNRAALTARLEDYRSGRPFRQPPLAEVDASRLVSNR